MLGFTFSSKLDLGSYLISIAKTTSKKIGALIRSMYFVSPKVALYLYKSTIQPCMEYCCHVWIGSPSCFLELFDTLQKQIFRTVDPLLAASLEPVAHRQNVASLNLFCRYYFGRCSSEVDFHLMVDVYPKTVKYWVGVDWGHSYLMGRRCVFSLSWPPF